jgi:ribose-phosphate pyrophosphokinase
MNILGNVEGKTVLLVDDMVDTAGTLCEASRALFEAGAGRIFAATVHPMLSGPAIERITQSKIEKVFVLDTIPERPEHRDLPWLERLRVDKVFAESILRIYREESISSLFVE